METVKNGATRLIAIDRFRGMVILLMVLANFFEGIKWIPAWMKHAKPSGITIVDLIAPAFLFVIALTFPLSFRKRITKDGTQSAYSHALIRGFAIMGIGLFMSAGESLFVSDDGILSFGVLEIIGYSILLAIPFITTHFGIKFFAAILFGLVHQFLALPEFSEAILSHKYDMARMLGPSSLLLFSLGMSDLFFKQKNTVLYVSFSIMLIISGIFINIWIPFQRGLYNFSLVIISVGIASFAFYIMNIISERFWKKSDIICTWGQNPLVIFILHYFLLLIFLVPSATWWYSNVSLPFLALQTVCYLLVIHAVVLFLKKKKIIIKV